MICPVCQSKIIVIDTRTDEVTGDVVRKRYCPKCKEDIFTKETMIDSVAGRDLLNYYYASYRRGLKPDAS